MANGYGLKPERFWFDLHQGPLAITRKSGETQAPKNEVLAFCDGIFHVFDTPPGSLTRAVKRSEHWWCHFAPYGKDNEKSVLVQYGDGWKEIGRWTFPKEMVADWGNYRNDRKARQRRTNS